MVGYVFKYVVYDLEGIKRQKQKELERNFKGQNVGDNKKDYIHISDEDFLAFEKMIKDGIFNQQPC